MRQNNVDFQNRELPTNILALLLAREQTAIAPLNQCAEAVSLLSINRRIQMRQNNVDFQNRELPTNILALLLAREQTAIAPLNQCDRLAATPKMAA